MESKVVKIVEDFIAKNTNASNLQAYQYKPSSSTENVHLFNTSELTHPKNILLY